jgi:hypothetical protein
MAAQYGIGTHEVNKKKQVPPRARTVPVPEAMRVGAAYGAMVGVVYPTVLRPVTHLLYGAGAAGASTAGVGGGILTQVTRWLDPDGGSPIATDVGVGVLFGALVGALWGVVYFGWWRRSLEPGALTWSAYVDWWLVATRVPGWWFQPSLSEADAVVRLQGQVNGTFIVHRDDSVPVAGTAGDGNSNVNGGPDGVVQSYRIAVTRDGAAPSKTNPSKHSAS